MTGVQTCALPISMNNSSLWLTSKTPSHELRALEVMHNLRLSMIRKTLGCELKALDVIHKLGLSMT